MRQLCYQDNNVFIDLDLNVCLCQRCYSTSDWVLSNIVLVELHLKKSNAYLDNVSRSSVCNPSDIPPVRSRSLRMLQNKRKANTSDRIERTIIQQIQECLSNESEWESIVFTAEGKVKFQRRSYHLQMWGDPQMDPWGTPEWIDVNGSPSGNFTVTLTVHVIYNPKAHTSHQPRGEAVKGYLKYLLGSTWPSLRSKPTPQLRRPI